MTIVTKKDRIGASRAKLALVGVLSVVLVLVIAAQWPESVESGEMATASVTDMPGWEEAPTAATPAANTTSASAGPAPPLPEKPARDWPEMTIDDVIAADPLAPAPWYLAAIGSEDTNDAGDDQQATKDAAESLVLAELQREGATIVLIAGGQRVATVGERQLRIGDKIEGYQVTDITDEGVILTKTRKR